MIRGRKGGCRTRPHIAVVDVRFVRRRVVSPILDRRAMQTSPRLSQVITPKDHAPLVTLDDACRYIAALPDDVAQLKAWRDAASLVLAARYGTPTESALKEVTKRLELALFVSFRLALGWRRAAERQGMRQAAGL
jgi:hypothetical protein